MWRPVHAICKACAACVCMPTSLMRQKRHASISAATCSSGPHPWASDGPRSGGTQPSDATADANAARRASDAFTADADGVAAAVRPAAARWARSASLAAPSAALSAAAGRTSGR